MVPKLRHAAMKDVTVQQKEGRSLGKSTVHYGQNTAATKDVTKCNLGGVCLDRYVPTLDIFISSLCTFVDIVNAHSDGECTGFILGQ